MTINRPNSACGLTTTAGEAIADTQNNAVWFGLASDGSARTVHFYDVSGASVQANRIATVVAPANEVSPMIGPYFPACGLLVAAIPGGSITIWIEK
ncbi:MAG: hypothetical protein ACXABY_02360 [Candidatus Thorarchaeota archaeon]|jgi:hypothetical protein